MTEPTLTPQIDTESEWNEEEDTFTPMSPYAVVGWAFLGACPFIIFAWVKGWF